MESTKQQELEKKIEEKENDLRALRYALRKIQLADVKSVSIPCEDCLGTGEDIWDDTPCYTCSNTGYRSVPLFVDKRDYGPEFELIDTLFEEHEDPRDLPEGDS